ncbi:MAG: hypothetical protein LBP28_00640 [Coriobacteriales bacterium]|jgi:tetratricopeptide (TPR) repeat protein|nr:hypothetical protein [Coriobacteriales bacterium]
MAKEWYRKEFWTKDAETEFFARLKRSQKHNRPQYLRIQASTLYKTNNADFFDAALNLLQRYFDEYPDDKLERSSSYELAGDIYCEMEEYERALENYKNALDYEKIFPQIITDSYLKYSKLIVQLDKTELFESVEQLLLGNAEKSDFPEDEYIKNAILSFINKQKDNYERANYYKNLAEKSAGAKSSGFRWHKKLGLVNNRDKLLDDLLEL